MDRGGVERGDVFLKAKVYVAWWKSNRVHQPSRFPISYGDGPTVWKFLSGKLMLSGFTGCSLTMRSKCLE